MTRLKIFPFPCILFSFAGISLGFNKFVLSTDRMCCIEMWKRNENETKRTLTKSIKKKMRRLKAAIKLEKIMRTKQTNAITISEWLTLKSNGKFYLQNNRTEIQFIFRCSGYCERRNEGIADSVVCTKFITIEKLYWTCSRTHSRSLRL